MQKINDYYKINALPYSDFFWTHQNKFQFIDRNGQNQPFFNSPEAIADTMLRLYNKHQQALLERQAKFLKEVDRGENIRALKQWNGWVKERAGDRQLGDI